MGYWIKLTLEKLSKPMADTSIDMEKEAGPSQDPTGSLSSDGTAKDQSQDQEFDDVVAERATPEHENTDTQKIEIWMDMIS